MAIQTFRPYLTWPEWFYGAGTNPSIQDDPAFEVDAINETCALICQSPVAGDISEVGFLVGDVDTGGTVTVSVYSVTTGGAPDAIWDTGTEASQALVAVTDDRKWFWVELGADATVALGDLFAIVFTNPGASPADFQLGVFAHKSLQMPYHVENTADLGGNVPLFAIKMSDGTVHVCPGCMIMGDTSGNTPLVGDAFSTSTTPDVFGVRFKTPFGVDTQCAGVQIMIDREGDGSLYLVASDWDGTEGNTLAKLAITTGQRGGNSGGAELWLFDAAVTLTADTWYRIVFVPSDTTSSSCFWYRVPDEASFNAVTGDGFIHMTVAKDPNDDTDWTNYNNGTDGYRMALMNPVFSGVETAGGGGGGGGEGPLVGGRLVG